jgi:hypothetical protein
VSGGPVFAGIGFAMAAAMSLRSARALALACSLSVPLVGCGGNSVQGGGGGGVAGSGGGVAGSGGSGGGAAGSGGGAAGSGGGDMAVAHDQGVGPGSTDMSRTAPPGADLSLPPGGGDTGDGGPPGTLADGGVFVPPPPPVTSGDMGSFDLGPVAHAPPATLAGLVILGSGNDFQDVSTDQGGGVWAVTQQAVYYWPAGATTPHTYDQTNGLAQGKTSWVDTYWCAGDGLTCPYTWPVLFNSIAGGQSGQAVVGNQGFIADRLDVDPASGAVQDVVGLQVTSTQQSDPAEMVDQQQRVVSSWKVALDLNGTLGGTAYLGGWHGLSAFHGFMNSATTGICGQNCANFEEHAHPITQTNIEGRDIKGIAVTPEGDLWVGDADSLWFIPQRSVGATADFFQNPVIPGQAAAYLDVFPGETDYITGVDVDAAGGIYVASETNGLAYLAPGSYAPTYWSAADKLPKDALRSVAVDQNGDVWIGTEQAGVARYTPSTSTWTYYTQASAGLPSNDIRAIHVDKYAPSGRSVYIATDYGVAVYTGP